jgi:hypothetical protein
VSRCATFCRDPRPPERGCAGRVASALDRAGLPASAMTAYLADVYGVARFADLCFSHADAIRAGLTKGILADDLARYVERPDDGSPGR